MSMLNRSNEVFNPAAVPEGPEGAKILRDLKARGVVPSEGKRLPVWASTVAWYVGICLAGYGLAVTGVRAPVSGVGFGRRRIKLGDT